MASSELFSTAKTAFEDAGWNFQQVEGREVLRAGFEAHHTRVDLHLQVFPPIRAVTVVAESTRSTDDPLQRDRLSELAMRVNEQLTVGNFEILWDSGRLVFRVTNLFPTPQGDASLIQGLVQNVVQEMDRIAPLDAIIHLADGPELAGLDIGVLLEREDLLPVGPESDS
ncbi:MAG: hypothetical protein P1U85_23175 [Verrucomicrobiales bacterium]|jgi:hypothetical protein|nr:hypothetical protein [Verrucomicrobiales bacterium]